MKFGAKLIRIGRQKGKEFIDLINRFYIDVDHIATIHKTIVIFSFQYIYLDLQTNTEYNSTSLPKGIPEPNAAVRPTVLAMRVRNVKYSFRTTPRMMVFISGIPEPWGRSE